MVHRDAQKLGRALLTLAPPQPPFASRRSGLSTRFSRIQHPTGIWRHSAPISAALGHQPRPANEAYLPLATLRASDYIYLSPRSKVDVSLEFMAAENDEEISGLALLRVAVTPALASYLNDLHSTLGLQAHLWRITV